MAKEFKVVISPDGSVLRTVYNDVFDIATIGKPEIQRATEVCFNNLKGAWEVIALKPLFAVEELLADGFKTRADALDWEIQFLNINMEIIINDADKRGS